MEYKPEDLIGYEVVDFKVLRGNTVRLELSKMGQKKFIVVK